MASSRTTSDDPGEFVATDPAPPLAEAYAASGTEPLDAETLTPEMQALIASQPAIHSIVEWCKLNASVDDESSAAAMEAMARRVLESDNIEEVLSDEMTVPVDKIVNRPVTLLGFRIGETDYEEGFPFYALMDVVVAAGEKPRVVTCGAWKVMAQLMKMSQIGEWPQVVEFRQSRKPTRAGFYPISMTRPQVGF